MNARQLIESQPRRLTAEEATAEGHDVSEHDLFPIMRFEHDGAILDFEEGPRAVWVLNVFTPEHRRNRGCAKRLLVDFYAYAAAKGKKILHGTFTSDGEKYIKPVIRRMAARGVIEALDQTDEDRFAHQLETWLATALVKSNGQRRRATHLMASDHFSRAAPCVSLMNSPSKVKDRSSGLNYYQDSKTLE